MKIHIQSIDFTATKELTDFVTETVEKLSHLSKNILGVKVYLKLENSNTGSKKICEIILDVPGKDLFVKKQCETFEEATKQATEVMQKQIGKMKTKLENY